MLKLIRGRARVGLVALLAIACGRQTQVSSPAGGPATPAVQSVSITDGESLIRAMHARYTNKWFHTMTFIQQTTLMMPSGSPTNQTWYEALSLPGRLRIDYGNPESGNGVLFRSDSNYQFAGGRLAKSSTGFNELLVLGFDVYAQPPEVTISILRSLGYQLSRMRLASFDGKGVYIVGAASTSDTVSKQFWVERDRLLFVRSLEKRSDGRQSDIRFSDYIPAGTGWVAQKVVQLLDGRVRLEEQYTNIKVDPPLDPALFDPTKWTTVKHWSK